MKTFPFSLTSSGADIVKMQGNYIRYMKCTTGTSAPGIAFKTDKGDDGFLYPGEDVTLDREFSSFQITNFDASTTVIGTLLVAGRGERYTAARISGEVSVNGSLTAVGTITNPVTVAGLLGNLAQKSVAGANALQGTPWPYTFGASFVSSSPLTANTPETVFSRAANTGGAIVWRAAYDNTNSASIARACITIKTASDPATTTDGQPLLTFVAKALPTLAADKWAGDGSMSSPVFVPSGYGCFAITNVTEDAGYRHVQYTLL